MQKVRSGTQNLPLTTSADVVERIASRSAARRGAGYVEEVRRLLDAGLAVMVRLGTGAGPRVSDIVAEAGLSNDAFYRHFASKDEFVTALIDAGTMQLERYLAEQMDGAADPAERIRRWVEGMIHQASDPGRAAIIRAVLWNGHRVSDDTRRRGTSREQLARMIVEPIAELGSADPERDALLACYACMLRMEEFLWRREAPTPDDVEHAVAFTLRAIGGTTP